MKQYKLVNENIGKETIEKLDDHLSSQRNDSDCSNGYEFEMDVHDLSRNIRITKYYQKNDPNKSLNNFIKDNYLDFDEIVFCLSGLNPIALLDIRSSYSEQNRCEKPVDLMRGFLQNYNDVYRKLLKAPRINELNGFVPEDYKKIYTKDLIPWAIDNGFIEEVLNNEIKNNNIGKFNNDRVNAKKHNTKVMINTFNKYKTKADTVGSFMDKKSNYDIYKSELIPMSEDGKLPAISTLQAYLYEAGY